MGRIATIFGVAGALAVLLGVALTVTQDLRRLSTRDNQALNAEIDAIVAQRQLARRPANAPSGGAEQGTTGVAEPRPVASRAAGSRTTPAGSSRKRVAHAEPSSRAVPPNFASLPVISALMFLGRHK